MFACRIPINGILPPSNDKGGKSMPRVVHFEITARDPERAARFYREVFGWTIDKWDGTEDYWLITTGGKDEPGINGAIMRSGENLPPTVNTIDVPSVDAYAEMVEANGGRIVKPKAVIPGVGYFAYCQDPEGNLFGIIQFDESAR
jgi:predicted enzyme related to lactoylglutathione lyase